MKNSYYFRIPLKQGGQVEYSVIVDGLFMYREALSNYESARTFVTDFFNGKHNFNECYGAYRVSIIPKGTGEAIHFSDNSGMMRFYINQISKEFCHSLLNTMPIEDRKPNYSAIAQFLSFGCVYSNETIFKNVVLSNPNCYYLTKNGQITETTKNLKELSEYINENYSLNDLIKKALAHCTGKIGCTITGGIDSRSVLANLIHLGIKPELAITGHELQPDVEIAKKIATATGLDLAVVSDSIEESDWLNHSIDAADGQDGICGIYRLDKLARLLAKSGIMLHFGGVAGEMYKNSFINQDFPFYFGKPNWPRFYKYKVGTFDFDDSLFSKPMQEELGKLPAVIIQWLKDHKGNKKAYSYLNAGYDIMQHRCHNVIEMFQKQVTIYNPLMERKMASYAFGKNPYSLEMQAFQRKEVTKNCKRIKNIKTDRGLTSNYNKRIFEFFNCYFYLIKVGIQRLFFRKKIDIRIDKCFEVGRQNQNFSSSIKNAQKIGILKDNLPIEGIPVGLADRLFTIGLIFETN